MKRCVATLICALAMIGISAKIVAAEQPYKFGYVDFQRALVEVEDGKKAKTMLKTEYDETQRKFEIAKSELQAMETDIVKQRLILSADALKEKEEEYRKRFMELQQKFSAYEQELATKQAKLTGDILTIIHQIVNDIGQKEGYTLILEKSQDIVLYSPTDADLTPRLIKEYNGLSKEKKQSMLKTATKKVK